MTEIAPLLKLVLINRTGKSVFNTKFHSIKGFVVSLLHVIMEQCLQKKSMFFHKFKD